MKEEDESLVDGRDSRRVRVVVGAREAVNKTGGGASELGAGLVRDDWKGSSLIEATGERPLLDPGLVMYAVQLRLLDGMSRPLVAIVGGKKTRKELYVPG